MGHALKERIQVVQSAEDDIYGSCKIEVVTGMVDRISSSSIHHQGPSTKQRTIKLAPVLEWMREGKSPTKAAIYQVRSKNTQQPNVSIPPAYFKGWGSASSVHP